MMAVFVCYTYSGLIPAAVLWQTIGSSPFVIIHVHGLFSLQLQNSIDPLEFNPRIRPWFLDKNNSILQV